MTEATLHQSNFLLRFRDGESGTRPALVKESLAEHPTKTHIDQLHNEYTVTRQLHGVAGVRTVLAKEGTERRPVLLLEYIEGSTLSDMIRDTSLDLATKLKVALSIAEILAEIHSRHVIHRDINSSNIVIAQEGDVHLIDFGIATTTIEGVVARIASHHTALGTLAYMSPEQTGHMDRPVDWRTDLYSFGVLLYELLSGHLPFEQGDTLEMIHSHVARQPVPPHELDPDIPSQLSDIVLKLLAKEPEDRFQSARGLGMDLQRCLEHLEATGCIERFELGRDDYVGQLNIPDLLYGRETEVRALEESYDRLCTGEVELIMIAGYSGVGKTALVHELRKRVVAKGGAFVEGKFDQVRALPYAAWRQAMTDLVESWLTEQDEVLERRRSTIVEAIGSAGGLLVDLVPSLEHIIGPQPAVQHLGGHEAHSRFNYVFTNFLQAAASSEHPLVLFLDDLQWIDGASLDLLELLALERLDGLLLVGAYRDNEVDSSHPLMLGLEELTRGGASLSTLTLLDLKPSNIDTLLADALATHDELDDLRRFIHRQTLGNPFFARRLLTSLKDEGYLAFDPDQRRWTWDREGASRSTISDNVAELLAHQMVSLPESSVELMTLAAHLGNRFDVETLAIVSERSEAEVQGAMTPAMNQRLISLTGEEYAFAHDRIQQVAYGLVDGTREGTHLRIGRLLLSTWSENRRQEKIFTLVDHLNLGQALIETTEERTELARLNLQAGIRAREAGAFATAGAYLRSCLSLLPRESWRKHHKLTFEVYRHAAEAEFLDQHPEASEELVRRALDETVDVLEKADLYELQITQLTMQARFDDAKAVGRKGLSLLGLTLPTEQLGEAVGEELLRLQARLDDRPLSSLLDDPELSDKKIRMTVGLLSSIVPACFFTDDILWAVAMGKACDLAFEHGIAAEFAYPFCGFGLALTAIKEEYELGYECGNFALAICERYGDRYQLAKVSEPFACHIFPWFKPVREAEPLIRAGYEAALESGELPYAGYMLSTRLANLLFWADDLDLLQVELDKSLSYNGKTQNSLGFYLTVAFQLFLRRLGRHSGECLSLDRSPLTEESFIEVCRQQQIDFALCQFFVLRGGTAYLFGNSRDALDDIGQARERISSITGMLTNVDLFFYHSLALCDLCSIEPPEKSEVLLEEAQTNQKQLERWSHICPENIESRYLLVEAEIARVSHHPWKAVELYDRAIKSARDNDAVFMEALGNELAGAFWQSREKEEFAGQHVRKALQLYKRWGAPDKVRELESRYPQSLMSVTIRTEPLASTLFTEEIRGVLDVRSLLKASRSIAAEVHIDQLLSTTLKIALENVGAQRGLIVLAENGGWRIAAEADINELAQTVEDLDQSDNELLASSIVRSVFRNKTPLVVSDAGTDKRFSHDPYIEKTRLSSVLCMPLLDRGVLQGAVYLENNLLSGAFTASRVEVLRLLSSQIAISLENARMHDNLVKSEIHLKRAQEIGRMGSWEVDFTMGKLFFSEEASRIYDIFDFSTLDYESFLDHVVPDDRGVVDSSWQAALRGESYDVEHRIRTGTIVKWVREKGEFELDGEGQAIRGLGTVQDITERKQAEEQLRVYQERLRALATELTVTEEKERRRIATELHDGAAQSLSFARLCLASTTQELSGTALAETVDDASSSIRESLRQIRNIMLDLSSPSLKELGLAKALSEWLEEHIGAGHGLETTFSDEANPLSLTDEVAVLLFRNARELLTNIVKHADAEQVSLRLTSDGKNLRVIIEDDGKGFDPESIVRTPTAEGSFGLFSIRERMADLSGQLEISSAPGEGCIATLITPLK